MEVVGEDRRHVEAALEHAAHLVPGLEHLSAVDALEDEALEDHAAPVDGDFARRDAEDGDATAVVHGREHALQRGRIAAHLEADVEALGHAELRHHVFDLLTGHVQHTRGAHASSELEAVVVHVREHDVARTDVTRDGRGHAADGTGPRDQHVLAHHVEGERRVRGVAERVEEGGDVIGDGVRQREGVARGDDEVLGEAAGAIHAHTLRVAAEVSLAGAAVAAMTTGDVALARDALSVLEADDLRAHLDHLADELVARDHGHRHRSLRPLVPVVDVHVRAADGRLLDANLDVVGAHLGLGLVAHPDALDGLLLDQGLHRHVLRAFAPVFTRSPRAACPPW